MTTKKNKADELNEGACAKIFACVILPTTICSFTVWVIFLFAENQLKYCIDTCDKMTYTRDYIHDWTIIFTTVMTISPIVAWIIWGFVHCVIIRGFMKEIEDLEPDRDPEKGL